MPKLYKLARGITLFFLMLFILLLFYTYFRVEIEYQGYQGMVYGKYFKYYVISLTGILFWGAVLRVSNANRLNIVLAATILVVGTYLIEIFLYVQKSYLKTSYQVFRDLKMRGVDAVTKIPPASFRASNGITGVKPLFPLAGISKKTTVFCKEEGDWSIYLSDRHGFLNPDAEWDASQTEFVLSGDSFTHGACVQPIENIAGQIRLKTGQNVLNLGYSGSGPLQELATLKEYAQLRKPNKVLWLYYEENDLVDLEEEISSSLLLSYLKPEFSQNLIRRQKEIDNKLNMVMKSEVHLQREANSMAIGLRNKKLLEKLAILRLSNLRARIGFDDNINTHMLAHDGYMAMQMKTEVDPLFFKILKQARDRIRAWGGKLYFVYLPARQRYETSSQERAIFMHRNSVLEGVKNLNLPIIDIHQELFSKHPNPMSLFPVQGFYHHYNPTGYSAVAKTIISRVMKAKSD